MIDDVVLGDNDAAGVFGTPNRPSRSVPAAIDFGINPAKVAKAACHSSATCGDCCSHDTAGEGGVAKSEVALHRRLGGTRRVLRRARRPQDGGPVRPARGLLDHARAAYPAGSRGVAVPHPLGHVR